MLHGRRAALEIAQADYASTRTFSELILDNGKAQPVVRILEDVVQQRGLARAEKAGENCHRHFAPRLFRRPAETEPGHGW
jgi:hypothetical protein